MELRERMIHLRRKLFLLFASVLLALAGVLAATHRSKPKPPADDQSRSHDRTATEQIPIKTQVRIFPLSETNQALNALKHDAIRGAAVIRVIENSDPSV